MRRSVVFMLLVLACVFSFFGCASVGGGVGADSHQSVIGLNGVSSKPEPGDGNIEDISTISWKRMGVDGLEEEPPSLGSISAQFVSQYVDLAGIKNYDKPSMQYDGVINLPNNLWLEVWGSSGLVDSETCEEFRHEIDLILGWSKEVFGLETDWGFAYQMVGKESSVKDDSFQPFAEFRKPLGMATPYLRFEILIPTNDTEEQWGAYIYPGVRIPWKFAERWTLSFDIGGTIDTGVYGLESGLMGRGSAQLGYRPLEHLEVYTFGQITTPLIGCDDPKDVRGTNIVGGVGLKFEF